SDATEWLGLGVGDTMTFRFRNDEEVTVTIAGLMDDPSGQGGVTVSTSAPTSIVLADGSLPAGVSHEPPTYVMAVEDEAVNDVVAELSNITGVFAVDVSQINELLDRLLSQFTALPLVIAVLALFASG
ncbi:MAG: hypothetical protein KDE28_12360, partial [Anaerolineales bacterium]|nr:hypothetical protein [Anaerolineales bacterium]